METAADVKTTVVSPAYADVVPGTVYLSPDRIPPSHPSTRIYRRNQSIENDVTVFGQAIYPVPSSDPNDPLHLLQWRKNAILIVVVLYSLIGNNLSRPISLHAPLCQLLRCLTQ